MDMSCVLMETFCVNFLLVTLDRNFARWSPIGETEETLQGGLYITSYNCMWLYKDLKTKLIKKTKKTSLWVTSHWQVLCASSLFDLCSQVVLDVLIPVPTSRVWPSPHQHRAYNYPPVSADANKYQMSHCHGSNLTNKESPWDRSKSLIITELVFIKIFFYLSCTHLFSPLPGHEWVNKYWSDLKVNFSESTSLDRKKIR